MHEVDVDAGPAEVDEQQAAARGRARVRQQQQQQSSGAPQQAGPRDMGASRRAHTPVAHGSTSINGPRRDSVTSVAVSSVRAGVRGGGSVPPTRDARSCALQQHESASRSPAVESVRGAGGSTMSREGRPEERGGRLQLLREQRFLSKQSNRSNSTWLPAVTGRSGMESGAGSTRSASTGGVSIGASTQASSATAGQTEAAQRLALDARAWRSTSRTGSDRSAALGGSSAHAVRSNDLTARSSRSSAASAYSTRAVRHPSTAAQGNPPAAVHNKHLCSGGRVAARGTSRRIHRPPQNAQGRLVAPPSNSFVADVSNADVSTQQLRTPSAAAPSTAHAEGMQAPGVPQQQGSSDRADGSYDWAGRGRKHAQQVGHLLADAGRAAEANRSGGAAKAVELVPCASAKTDESEVRICRL